MPSRFQNNLNPFSSLLHTSIFVVIFVNVQLTTLNKDSDEMTHSLNPIRIATEYTTPSLTETNPIRVVFPDFIKQIGQTIFVEEGRDPGSFLASITISDQLESDWSVSLSDDTFKLLLSYHNAWGLHTTSILDREVRAQYNLSISASPRNNSLYQVGQIFTYTIFIELIDINDNAPVFDSNRTDVVEFPVGAIKAGSHITELTASDNDIGLNSEIVFKLDNYNDLFDINPKSGVITSLRDLHLAARYDVIVRATDLGTPALSTSTILTINVHEDHWSFYRIYRMSILIGLSALVLITTGVVTICIVGHCLFNRWVIHNQLRFSFLPFNNGINDIEKGNVDYAATDRSLKSPIGSPSCFYGSPLSIFPCIHFSDTCDFAHQSPFGPINSDVKSPISSKCHNPRQYKNDYKIKYFENKSHRDTRFACFSRRCNDEVVEDARLPNQHPRARSDDGCYCSSDISSDRSDRHKNGRQPTADGLVVRNAVDHADRTCSRLACFARPIQIEQSSLTTRSTKIHDSRNIHQSTVHTLNDGHLYSSEKPNASFV